MDLSRALQRVNRLIDDFEPGSAEADELEILSVLIADYEGRTVEIPDASPAQVLRFVMEHNGLSVKDMVPFIGPPNRVYDVLGGKRKLTVRMIRNLTKGLHIPAEALI